MAGTIGNPYVESHFPAPVGDVRPLEPGHGHQVPGDGRSHAVRRLQVFFGLVGCEALVEEVMDQFRRPHADERPPRAGAVAGKAVVPVDEAVLEGCPFPVRPDEAGLRRPGRPAVLKGTAHVEMTAVIADNDSRSDVADFPAADIAQGGHDLTDEGMEAFRPVIGIGLEGHLIRLLSQLRLPWPLLQPASSGILRSSHRPSADGRRCGSGGAFPGSFPAFPGGRLHIPRPCRSPGK